MIPTASPEILPFMQSGRNQRKTAVMMEVQETAEIQEMKAAMEMETIRRMAIILMKH